MHQNPQMLFLVTFFLFFGATTLPGNDGRPNVLLILVDDYGYGDISAEGNTQIHTPNIDRIADEGTRYTRFYQSAGACAPTRASLLTGRYFYETGVWGVHWGRDFIHRDEHTLGDLLQSAGYQTGVFGKWHSGKTNAYFGWNRGFDTSVHTRLYEYYDTRVLADNKLIHVDGPMTDVVGDRAKAFIEANRHQPFFCYVPFQAVHEPFNSPPELFEKYKSQGYTDHVARLYGMIETLDQNIGKLLDTLEEHGLAENTLVLFMVDDGASPGFDLNYQTRRMNDEEREQRRRAWGRRLKGTKANIGEGGQISPFYARWPGKIPAGRSVELLSGVIDIYPTLAEICNASLPDNQLPLRGRSIAPSLLGKPQDFSDRIYFDGTNLYLIERETAFVNGIPRIRHLSAHYKNFKYVREDRYLFDGTDRVVHRLYDLSADPSETRDISADNPAMTERLQLATEDWFQGQLATGRAFLEATYPVGSLEERGTAINLDATTETFGTVVRDPGPGFVFEGWDQAGDGLAYSIDVLESGSYQVELNYRLEDAPTGAVFEVGILGSSSLVKIDNPSRSLSAPMTWPAGPARLSIKLKDIGNATEAIEWLDLVVVKRIPHDEQGIPRNAGFTLTTSVGEQLLANRRDEAREFLAETEAPVHSVTAGAAYPISLELDNPQSIRSWRCYLGFEKAADSEDPSETLWIRPLKTGRQTLTVEWSDLQGHDNSARMELNLQ